MTAAEILRSVRVKLTTPECWMQHHNAVDEFGDSVHPADPTAACWCLEGAIYSHRDANRVRALGIVLDVLEEDGELEAFEWNDDPDRTHAEVLDLLDRSIAKATGGER